MSVPFMDQISLPLLATLTFAAALTAVEVGCRLGAARRRRGGESGDPVGASVGATLGLLAFILAFTFGMASSRYDDRKQLVLDDANALGTCYLRTEFLPETERAQAQVLLREYAAFAAKVNQIESDEELLAGLRRVREIHAELWQIAAAAGQAQPTPLSALFVASCNDVFDIFDERITKGLENRIPVPVWAILYLVALLSMVGLGYQVGLADDRRSIGTLFLTLTFSTVIVLIADLDNSRGGLLVIDQQPMIKLAAQLQAE